MTKQAELDILFKSTLLEKDLSEDKRLRRRFGPVQAKLIRRRLDELRAADGLADMRTIPQTRCHELTGNRKGQLSVDLKHPYRLLFRPVNEPVPTKPDGGLDWGRVTEIEILGVEDTHE